MAGIEQIIVHSKSYVVRWISVPEHQSISWSVEPHKKSINFGIFKHPGTKGGLTPILPTHETVDGAPSLPPTPGLEGLPAQGKRARQGSVSQGKNDESTAVAKLKSIGLKEIAWKGKCEADKVSMGRYDVPEGEGGTYGMVFDNTFSKQKSKTVHFVLMTHPTNAPPKSGHHLHYSQAFAAGSTSTVGKGYSPSLQGISDSSDAVPASPLQQPVLEDPRPPSKGGKGTETVGLEGATFYTGVLNKKRRKKGQGYAKRFFSLDFTSSTLSYYRDRHSSALRGAVPLQLAAVGADAKRREFSIDSGAEVWHLKAPNKKEYDGWCTAFERASSAVIATSTPATPAKPFGTLPKPKASNPEEDREWQRVEELVSKVSGTRDAVRGLAKDTDPKYLPGVNGAGLALTYSGGSSTAPSPSTYESGSPYFPDMGDAPQEKRPFWRRKPSGERSQANILKRSVSAQLAVPSPSTMPLPPSPNPGSLNIPKRPAMPRQAAAADEDVHDRCMALLRDLDNVVSDFAALIAESKARRIPPLPTSGSRMSFESIDNEEFFDAEDGGTSPSHQLLNIQRSEEELGADENDHGSDADSDTSSDVGDAADRIATTPKTAQEGLFTSLPKSLPPLPLPPVKRRATIAPPKQAPPSIIGFLRKNAGKDLSTVAMPVTANEPTSLLQRLAESVEYPQLLDSAASSSIPPAERLMYVTAFAISYFANNRVKERAIRKPFNPMLGETYELVREDLGVRFLAEKVNHHPVRMACQAESLANGGWCFAQSPSPIQKFWGKSVELNTEGRARVVLHEPTEHYSWNQATCYLRNVMAGEKYVEPVQTMTVHCETNGMRAVATFKAGGMFSGRSEELNVQLFDPASGDLPLALGITGKWTESLKRTDTGDTIWTAGSLVPDAPKTYGFTTFAAALNEVTEVEDGQLPPTDSRLRPDQKALENGDVDKAEATKARLEERQRSRKKVRESHGQTWQPQFFEKVDGGEEGSDEVWMLKGKGGYWERRAKGDWSGMQEVFET